MAASSPVPTLVGDDGIVRVRSAYPIGETIERLKLFFFPYVFPPPPAAEQLAEGERSKLVASGMFIHANPSDPVHYGKGRVSVYAHTVFLESDFEVGPGPAFHVYLVPKASIRSSSDLEDAMFVDLGGLRAFKGSQRYPIPAGVNLHLVRALRRSHFAGGSDDRRGGKVRNRDRRDQRLCAATTRSSSGPGTMMGKLEPLQ